MSQQTQFAQQKFSAMQGKVSGYVPWTTVAKDTQGKLDRILMDTSNIMAGMHELSVGLINLARAIENLEKQR
jgi:hypothetical protein